MAGRLHRYYITKRKHARQSGIEFHLTEDDIQTLLDEAGITVDDIGQQLDKYQLGRYGDTGPYEMGNCRFITMKENLNEMTRRFTGYPVKILGKTYDSMAAASRATGNCVGTVRNRCNSPYPKWKDWQILTDWRYNDGR